MDVILSILVISHNQRKKLRRCIESLLAQDLPFEHEIIISDDASTDGTWELIQDYVSMFPDIIRGYQVNSDDCNPTNTSERSGHNRSNAYKHARGKYIVHVDGDDFLMGTDSYYLQVDLLERHPECSMCMQNIWIVQENDSICNGHTWFSDHKYQTGQIIKPKSFFSPDSFIQNQAFMIRRNLSSNPADLYHKFYVDNVITYHHLQFGPIVYLDRCGYVYECSSSSIMASYKTMEERDIFITIDFTVMSSLLVPKFTGLYLNCYKKDLLHAVNFILKDNRLEYRRETLKYFDAFICDVCVKKALTVLDKCRLHVLRIFLILLIKYGFTASIVFKMLYKLLIRAHYNSQCCFIVD